MKPYSVDQTFFFEKGHSGLNSKLYEKVLHIYRLREPTILTNKGHNEPFVVARYQGHYDAQVFLPILSNKDGLVWRKLIPGAQKIRLGGWHCPKNRACLLQAVMDHEKDAHFVPVDQTLISRDTATLYLPPGKYFVRLLDEQDALLSERQIVVSAEK